MMSALGRGGTVYPTRVGNCTVNMSHELDSAGGVKRVWFGDVIYGWSDGHG